MPFALIPSALGACFALVWVFIGGMLFRDSLLAAQRERESEISILPLAIHRVVGASPVGRVGAKRRSGERMARMAS